MNLKNPRLLIRLTFLILVSGLFRHTLPTLTEPLLKLPAGSAHNLQATAINPSFAFRSLFRRMCERRGLKCNNDGPRV